MSDIINWRGLTNNRGGRRSGVAVGQRRPRPLLGLLELLKRFGYSVREAPVLSLYERQDAARERVRRL